TTNDYQLARIRNWLHTWDSASDAGQKVGTTLNMERDFSPDGTAEGQKTWFGYADKTSDWNYESQTNNFPAYIAQRLPDGGTRYTYFEYNVLGAITLERTTNIINGVSLGEKTRTYTYDMNNIDLLLVTNYSGVQEAGYSYDANHHRLTETNAVGDVTSYSYDANGLRILISPPSGLNTTNIYEANLRLSQTIDLEISRTNTYTWTNGQIYTHTDARGMSETNSWDALRRLTNSANANGSTKYTY